MNNNETPIIFMDHPKTGEPVYIQTHVKAVDGLPDIIENLSDNDVFDDINKMQNRIDDINNQVSNLSTISEEIGQIKQDIYNLKLQMKDILQKIEEGGK
jgi:uncharacterized protein YdcH (DUF465 family)